MATAERIERIRRLAFGRQRAALVLEDIHDRYNAAAVYRSCDAFGVQVVHLVFDASRTEGGVARGFNPRAAGRVASGSANQWLDFVRHGSVASCYEGLRASGHTIVALTPDAEGVPIDRFDFAACADVALVLGNEHAGLSEPASRLADARVMIPMAGMVQSLNLAVTAAVALHEMTRQRRAAGMERFLLPEDAREALASALIARRGSGQTNEAGVAGQKADPRTTRTPRRRKGRR